MKKKNIRTAISPKTEGEVFGVSQSYNWNMLCQCLSKRGYTALSLTLNLQK